MMERRTLTRRGADIDEELRCMDYGAARACAVVAAALEAAVVAGTITTPEECVGVVRLVGAQFERDGR